MTTQPSVNHDDEVTYSSKDWIYLLLSLVFQGALLMFASEWAWVGLPFWTTFLVKALKQL